MEKKEFLRGIRNNEKIIKVERNSIFDRYRIIEQHKFTEELVRALAEKNFDLAIQLIEKGANPNIQFEGEPLFIKAIKEYPQLAEYLASNPNVNVNVRNQSKNYEEIVSPGETPIIVALGFENRSIVSQLLLRTDLDVNMQDDFGNTPLLAALKFARMGDFIFHFSVAEILIRRQDTDVNLCDEEGNTPLMVIVNMGYPHVLDLLLQREDLDINLQNYNGDTALMIATRNGFYDVVERLLKCRGIDKNIKNVNGETALTIAKQNGYIDLIEILK